jgi:hypothetical protein
MKGRICRCSRKAGCEGQDMQGRICRRSRKAGYVGAVGRQDIKKELYLPCLHQFAPLSTYIVVLAAPIRRGKMPSASCTKRLERHQEAQRCIP